MVGLADPWTCASPPAADLAAMTGAAPEACFLAG